MEDKWQFLRPWRETLRECKSLHDSLAVEDSREFRASQLPVRASLRCWPSLPKGYEQLAGRCAIPIPFPADIASRRDARKLQRIREAVELFNVLAAVSRPAFLQLLGDFVVVADNFADLFTPDLIFVFPVWECYLVGTVASEDDVADGSTVSWGALFGCSEDPRQHSTEFCAAMEKLEDMRREVTGALCDFMGRQATAEWSEGCNVIEWTAEHVAIPTNGVQDAARCKVAVASADFFSRELSSLLEVDVPAVVQLCAVSDSAKMLEMWERMPPNPEALTVETMKPRFAAPGGVSIATALSRMNLTSLRLSLDEIVDSMATGDATSTAGFLLSTLVCGRPLCEATATCGPPRTRQGKLADLQVTFAGSSAAGPAGLLSAMTESVSIQNLTLNMGTLGDRIWWLNQVRWGWLAYAFWSNVSNSSVQSARLTNIHLSASTVASVASAISKCFPPSTLEQNALDQSIYGFIDVKEGAKLRPRGLDESDGNNSVVLSRDCRCRARYDPIEMGDLAEVIVPGYGVCDLHLGNGTHRFTPCDSVPQRGQGRGLQSLTLEFFQIEEPSLVTDLLTLIGGDLRSLRMGMFWRGRRRCISLDAVAVACPHLEELCLTDFDVVLSSEEGLNNWGLRKLTIHGSDVVLGLADRLRDPICRLSYQLEVLEISVPRSVQSRAAYAESLTSLNGNYLAAMKERFPLRSKAAIISTVDEGRETTQSARAVHQLNETMMSFIFELAATPKRRSVRVIM